MRVEAHARIERGTRCAMEGTCEPGGAYKRDPEINEQVRAAIAADRRFADTSVWITTSRKWATLEGCVRTPAQRTALVRFVAQLPNVERVFDELRVGARQASR
jgi:osmotically-inducible protein OsmY